MQVERYDVSGPSTK